MLICWDLAFPEAFRELIGQGAKIIIIPTFCMSPLASVLLNVLLHVTRVSNIALTAYTLSSRDTGRLQRIWLARQLKS